MTHSATASEGEPKGRSRVESFVVRGALQPFVAEGPTVLKTLVASAAQRMRKALARTRLLVLCVCAGGALAGFSGAAIYGVRSPALSTPAAGAAASRAVPEGIGFACADEREAVRVRAGMRAYLATMGIPQSWTTARTADGLLTFALTTPAGDTSTLDFVRRKAMGLEDAVVRLPTGVAGKVHQVHTASTKEIVLALLQHGRLTELPCSVDALSEHVGVRQNIAAWAERLEWVWPDGDVAKWNAKYWDHGTPRSRYPLHEAVNDAFMNPGRYRIGCYTATKLVILQGVLDYYRRVRPDRDKLRRIEARLAADGEPLVDIEPAAMWFFEEDYAAADAARSGKLVVLQHGVAADNFVPGDWVYLLNTDAASYRRTGYEGSNAIYLGRDRFDDYYNDHDHAYSFREKLDEVYQWRHGVFNRSRDAAKIRPLPERELLALAKTPETGGLLLAYRAVVSYGISGLQTQPVRGAAVELAAAAPTMDNDKGIPP